MRDPPLPLAKRLAAEALGSAFLLAIIIGSGIMGERLAGGNAALALLANSFATGCGLAVLIYVMGPISGAHFNPLVTAAAAMRGELLRDDALPYIAVQMAGAIAGVAAANSMFGGLPFVPSTRIRTGWAQWESEAIATFGLLTIIFLLGGRDNENRPGGIAIAVGAYIAAAYWFTSSTSFANPAVTFARALTNTFAGIRPEDVPPFVLAQCLGCAVAMAGVKVFERERT
jgi:glycerol uptake facilitator-like aquaporin